MAINRLKKVYIAAPRSEKETLLKELQKASILHIEKNLAREIEEETKEKEVLTHQLELQLNKAEYIIEYLKPYERKKTLAQHIEEAKEIIDYQKLHAIPDKCDLEKIYNQCYNLNRRMKELQSEENDLRNWVARLEPYKYLEVNFEEIHDTEQVRTKLGYIGEDAFKSLHLAVEDCTPYAAMYRITKEYHRHDYFFIAYLKEVEAELEKLFLQFNFREDELNITGTVANELERVEKRRKAIDLERMDVVEKSHLLADWMDRVRLYCDLIMTDLEKKKAEGFLYETTSAFIVKGWVRANEMNKLRELTSRFTSCHEIVELDPDDEEPVPVELVNHPLVQPMEFVTQLYSYPNYREYDPTPLYFIFYILFFATCLTEAGYGVVMTILAYAALKILHARGDAAKLLKVLLYGGIATVVTGALTGGWFGIDYSKLPSMLQSFVILKPMDQALIFLAVSLYMGLVHLVWGQLIGAYQIIFSRKNNYQEAIEKLLWAAFFTAGTPLIVNGTLLNMPFSPEVTNALSIISTAAIGLQLINLTIKGVMEIKMPDSVGGKIFASIFGFLKAFLAGGVMAILKSIIDFASNVLSYSRLMALGLATGGIALAVNTLAAVATQMLSGSELTNMLGLLIAFVILIIGHLFNLAISGLGAMVHTARLQYVEFFPNFFEGGGKPFEPFSVKTRYNTVANGHE